MFPQIPADKQAHFILGVLVYAVFHFLSVDLAIMLVFVAAFGKEIHDYMNRDKHTPEFMDAMATIGGGLVGWICGLKF